MYAGKHINSALDVLRFITHNQFMVARDVPGNKAAAKLWAMIEDYITLGQAHPIRDWDAAVDDYFKSVGKAKAS